MDLAAFNYREFLEAQLRIHLTSSLNQNKAFSIIPHTFQKYRSVCTPSADIHMYYTAYQLKQTEDLKKENNKGPIIEY